MNLFSQLFGGAGSSSNNLSAAEYKSRYVETNSPHVLIDVRTLAEYKDGHITGAKNIPLQEVTQRLAQIPHGKPIMVYCRSGNRSGMALQMLQTAGYEEVYNVGGIGELVAQGLPVQASALA